MPPHFYRLVFNRNDEVDDFRKFHQGFTEILYGKCLGRFFLNERNIQAITNGNMNNMRPAHPAKISEINTEFTVGLEEDNDFNIVKKWLVYYSLKRK